MTSLTATAIANPNIALIKYWGDRDPCARVPANSSLSMNLGGLFTRTTVTYDPVLAADELWIDGQPVSGAALERVSLMLDRVCQMAGISLHGRVDSENNFPMGAGIASSASGFAALSLAASTAAGLDLDERSLSRLARSGSGSACRSIPAGFVEWQAGSSDEDSYAFSIAPPDHWNLADCVAIVSQGHKPVGSSEGHALATSSPLQAARVVDTSRRLDVCREALCQRDFSTLADVVELDSNVMHAVMLTSTPPLIYWQPATLAVIRAVVDWRRRGLPVCYTIDAGPNVHVLTLADDAENVAAKLGEIPGVGQVLTAHPGGPARLCAIAG